MLTTRRWTLLLSLVLIGAVSASCDHAPPTAASVTNRPSVHADAALTGRVPFSEDVPAGAFEPGTTCPGLDHVEITGTITGWDQYTELASGREHVTENDDFSQLSATGGAWSWVASSEAHEIWSWNVFPDLGLAAPAAQDITHEGRSLFIGLNGAPNFILVHRIHEVVTPSGDITVWNITPVTAECI